jgi:lipopolysaccharide export LptBFGC system permease protein LptF
LATEFENLQENLQEQATGPDEQARPTHYGYKASLIGAAQQFDLIDAGLSWRFAGRSGLWRYSDITAIRLSYRPVSMQARRFRADLRHVLGGHLVLISTSWQTAALMAPQDRDYRVFMIELHERMARAGSVAALTGGLKRWVYAAAVALLALVGTGMAVLLVRALTTGQFAGAAFLVGFAALFSWQVGGFVTRNRPVAYTFEHVPERLLP